MFLTTCSTLLPRNYAVQNQLADMQICFLQKEGIHPSNQASRIKTYVNRLI